MQSPDRARSIAMLSMVIRGETYAEVAKAYGLSVDRIKEITRRFRQEIIDTGHWQGKKPMGMTVADARKESKKWLSAILRYQTKLIELKHQELVELQDAFP